jgi:membrane protease YdiL (CAAX protease family)
MTNTQKGPWGPWATLALFLVVIAGIVAAQTMAAVSYAVIVAPEPSEAALTRIVAEVGGDGLFVSLNEIVTSLVALWLTVSFVWFRRGPLVRDYLALQAPQNATILAWLTVGVSFLLLTDGLIHLSGQSPVPPWMLKVWASHQSLPLFIAATVVMAPVMEEVVFRGFLFAGLERSRLGPGGAVVLTAVLWAVIHTQYELVYVLQIVGAGLLFGFARHRTRTVTVPILMHAFANGLALIEVMVKARG